MSGLDKNHVSNFYLRYRSRYLEVRILYPPLNQFIVRGSLTVGEEKESHGYCSSLVAKPENWVLCEIYQTPRKVAIS